MFVVDDQDHPQMIEICAELQRLSGPVHDARYVPYTKLVLHDVEEKKRCSICVTIVRNWILHCGSSMQLLVLHSE
jgi:hypothetical protein